MLLSIISLLLTIETPADDLYGKAVESLLQSSDVTQIFAASVMYENAGNYALCVTELERCAHLAAAGNKAYYLTRAGELAALSGDHKRASGLFLGAAKASTTQKEALKLRADTEAARGDLDAVLPMPVSSEKIVPSEVWSEWSGKATELTRRLRVSLSKADEYTKVITTIYIAQVYERLGYKLVALDEQGMAQNDLSTKLSPGNAELYDGITIAEVMEMAGEDYGLSGYLLTNSQSPDWRIAGPVQEKFYTIMSLIGKLGEK